MTKSRIRQDYKRRARARIPEPDPLPGLVWVVLGFATLVGVAVVASLVLW